MPQKPNVILITVDALRADHLGFMGYPKNVSPNIDSLAKESTVFSNAFSTGPGTPYSFPAILTSTYPLDYQGPRKMADPRTIVSQVFQEQGYITGAFHSSVYLSNFFGYNRGWEFFEESFSAPKNLVLSEEKGILEKKRGILFSAKKFLIHLFLKLSFKSFPYFFFWLAYLNYRIKASKKQSFKEEFSSFDNIIQRFIFSMENQEQPFFLWIHYMDVHRYNDFPKGEKISFSEFLARTISIYVADYYSSSSFLFKRLSKKYIEKSQELYDKAIAGLDRKIGSLIQSLKDSNLYDDSIICFSADHGEEFLEHKGADHMTDKLYNELLHVPFFLCIPGRSNETVAHKVSLIDLSPTLCALCGLTTPASFKGKDLFQEKEKVVFHQSGWASEEKIEKWVEVEKIEECKMACQNMDWKYIFNCRDSSEEIYDLNKDPKEQENLVESHPGILFEMRKKIEEFKKSNPPLSLLNNYEKVF